MLISFSSTSHAIRAEKVLLENNIKATVLPLPNKIRAGCGICLMVDDNNRINEILSENEIQFKIHYNE